MPYQFQRELQPGETVTVEGCDDRAMVVEPVDDDGEVLVEFEDGDVIYVPVRDVWPVNSRSTYLGPFRFACTVCGTVHFMEREAIRCCPPIRWRPSVENVLDEMSDGVFVALDRLLESRTIRKG